MAGHNNIKICFVGMDNYPMLNDMFNMSNMGGESVQQTLLAKAFVKHGYDVSTIVKNYGNNRFEIIDGIKIYKAYKDSDGLPIVRFVYPRLMQILKCLSKADADIYYQSCAGMLTGVVALFCRLKKKKFIYRVASDSDCIPEQLLINNRRDKWLYHIGLRMADMVLAQSNMQKGLLNVNFKRDSHVVNMILESPDAYCDCRKDYDVLWVNNIRKLKRPEIVIKLAERLPELSFCMIGGPCGDQGYFETVKDMADNCSNIEFKGFLPYKIVNSIISKSKLVINTSEIEGFPNTFLQSWIRSVPVVSFFDPDSVIKSHYLGYAVKTVEDMADAIVMLMTDSIVYEEMCKSACRFAIKNYSETRVMKQYAYILEDYIL